jgi:thioredoxin-related protein
MRRIIKVITGIITGFAAALACAELPPAADLAADARAAAGHGAPILVFFSQHGCGYCDIVEGLYLEPMQERRTYGERLVIRKVDIGSSAPLADFEGRRTSHAAFASVQGARFTPTVRLYDPDGRELTEQLRGFTSEHFYGGQLEAVIEQAQSRLAERRLAADCGAAVAKAC